jgi:hypothetical protein
LVAYAANLGNKTSTQNGALWPSCNSVLLRQRSIIVLNHLVGTAQETVYRVQEHILSVRIVAAHCVAWVEPQTSKDYAHLNSQKRIQLHVFLRISDPPYRNLACKAPIEASSRPIRTITYVAPNQRSNYRITARPVSEATGIIQTL